MAETIKISLELADKAAQQSLSDFINKADKADKGFQKLGESGKSSFNEITLGIGKSIGVYDIFAGNLAANVVVGAFNLIKEAAGAAFETFIVDGVKAAQESENALNSLNVALAQNGHYSQQASSDFQEYAKSIQATTAYEDDAIIKNAALIESMSGLSKDGLKRATSAAVELSAALGIDLETATTAVAKAANGNVTSLQKMGVQFAKAGTDAGTFENALVAIETRFGGTAASKLNTFTGALEQSKNVFGDLQEEIGGIIVQNPAIIAAINAVTDVIKNVTGAVGENKSSLAILVAEGFVGLIEGTKYIVAAFDVMVSGIRGSYNLIMEGTFALIAAVTGALSPFSDTMKEIFDATVQAGADARKAVDDIYENGSFSDIQYALDQIGDAASNSLSKMKSGAEGAAPAIENTKNAVKKLSEEEKKRAEENDKYVESLAKQNDSAKAGYENQLAMLTAFYEQKEALDVNADVINYAAKLEREQSFYTDKQVLLDQNLALELQKINESTVADETKNAARIAAQAKFQADSQKLAGDHSKKMADLEKAKNDQLIANQKTTFSTIATLSQSNNVNLANIGKAAGIAQIAIETPVAIAKALAAAPPPFNFALAALVGTAMAAQAAQIAGLSFEQGGIVPGSSFTGDNVSANVNSGEMILNRQQQAELFKIANGNSSNDGLSAKVDAMLSVLTQLVAQPLVVNVDGRQLINITRDQLASGRSI